jgi:predicted transcriptional regulator of viral defense system
MPLDLEHELLRAAHAMCALRATRDFSCTELLAFLEHTSTERAFPRISHRLVSHLIDALASTLAQAGLLERLRPGRYALTELAFAHLEREPALLSEPAGTAVAIRGRTG